MAVAWGSLCGSGSAAQPAAPPDDDSVALPPYIIEAFERPLSWRYLQIPGAEMLTVCDDTVSTQFFRRIYFLEQHLRLILPAEFQAGSSVPRTTILFNDELNRMHSREVIAEMLKNEGAQAMEDGTPAPTPRQRVPHENSPYRTFLPDLRLSDVDAVATFAAVSDSAPRELEFTLETSWIAYLVEHRVPRLPDWFITGIQGVYRDATLRDDGLTLGRALWISEAETRAFAANPDRPRELLSMAEMFSRRRAGPDADAPRDDALWRAQCTLFVRWALLAHKGAYREALWTLVRRLDGEALDETLFFQCFGFGYADARDRLSDYLPVAVNERENLRGPAPIAEPQIRPRPATPVEVARIRGDWERMEIRYVGDRYPQLTSRYADQARRTLRKPYDRGERDPGLLAVMGLLECDAGNPDGARYYLEAAAQGRVPRPRVYVELAQLRLKEERNLSASRELAPEQVARVLEPLQVALSLDPPLAETYRLFADACVLGREPVQPAHLAVLDQGVDRFPDYSPFVFRVVAMHAILGHRDHAAALAQVGLRHATDPAAIERFRRALANLAPDDAK